ncbi:hypothetical protein [Phycobacter azelaicus]|jgi:hypothetical protein|uniref:hypothetical protein n=1 Tax=Phycobacter azelaicus TaxID=2668075 RepID=UPI0018693A77|nr:hypothetical protein [Phycobacter azelaicus]MBE1295021.1 hypothetical protein [Paracoccaceae bacterium]
MAEGRLKNATEQKRHTSVAFDHFFSATGFLSQKCGISLRKGDLLTAPMPLDGIGSSQRHRD